MSSYRRKKEAIVGRIYVDVLFDSIKWGFIVIVAIAALLIAYGDKDKEEDPNAPKVIYTEGTVLSIDGNKIVLECHPTAVTEEINTVYVADDADLSGVEPGKKILAKGETTDKMVYRNATIEWCGGGH